MKSLLIGTLMCCLVGCANNPAPKPPSPGPVVVVPPIVTQPPVVQQPEQKRTDLPLNWSEVKGDVWSYGIPMGFDAVQHDKSILAAHKSIDKKLLVTLDTDTTADNDLTSFVTAWLLANQTVYNKQVIQSATKTTDDGPLVAVQLGWDTAPNKFSTSLDFFFEKSNTVYHIACIANDAADMKKSGLTCFDIADTLQVK